MSDEIGFLNWVTVSLSYTLSSASYLRERTHVNLIQKRKMRNISAMNTHTHMLTHAYCKRKTDVGVNICAGKHRSNRGKKLKDKESGIRRKHENLLK